MRPMASCVTLFLLCCVYMAQHASGQGLQPGDATLGANPALQRVRDAIRRAAALRKNLTSAARPVCVANKTCTLGAADDEDIVEELLLSSSPAQLDARLP